MQGCRLHSFAQCPQGCTTCNWSTKSCLCLFDACCCGHMFPVYLFLSSEHICQITCFLQIPALGGQNFELAETNLELVICVHKLVICSTKCACCKRTPKSAQQRLRSDSDIPPHTGWEAGYILDWLPFYQRAMYIPVHSQTTKHMINGHGENMQTPQRKTPANKTNIWICVFVNNLNLRSQFNILKGHITNLKAQMINLK